jgi:hypothetical protein
LQKKRLQAVSKEGANGGRVMGRQDKHGISKQK